MSTTTRTVFRQKVSRKLYSGHDIIVSTAELIRKDSGTDVNEDFAAADTTLTVDDGTKFTVGDFILIDNEILSVTAISTNDLTVALGMCGTTDVAHADNSDIYIYTEAGIGNGLTTLCDSKLAPTAEVENFVGKWVYISTQPTKTDSGTDLNEGSDITATETIFTVDDGTAFTVGDGIQIDSEIMRVTAISTHDLTVVRGIQSTTAAIHLDNADVYLIGPAVGEVIRVTDVDFSAESSLLILFPALSARLVSGQEYEIHYKFYPTKIHQKIDEILENLRRPIWLPLSLITDGDMEDDPANNYTLSGRGALAEETTTVLFGRKSLKVTAAAAGDYAESGSVYLPPNTSVFCAALCYITGGDSAKLTLYDKTNSDDIETAESAATGWVLFAFIATLPATCEEVSLQLESQGSGDITYWDCAILLPTQRQVYAYPSTLEWSEDLDGIFYFPRGPALSTSDDDNAYRIFENPAEKWSEVTALRDETAVTPYRLQIQKTPVSKMLFVRGLMDFSVLSSDSSTTYAPEDIVVDLVHAEMLDLWADEDMEEGRDKGFEVKSVKADRIRDKLSPRMQHFRPRRGKVRGAM